VIAHVRNSNEYKSGSAQSEFDFDFAALPAAGNTIIVFISTWADFGTGDPMSVTDNQGNGAYTQLKVRTGTTSSVFVFYKADIGTPMGTFTVSVTLTGSAYPTAIAAEFSGIDTTNPVDSAVDKSETDSDTTVTLTSDSVTTYDDDLIISAATADFSDANTWSLPSGYTNILNQTDEYGSYNPLAADYKIISSAETPEVTYSWSNSHQYAVILAAFKAAGGGEPEQSPVPIIMQSLNQFNGGCCA
jgi:hypothetical protein